MEKKQAYFAGMLSVLEAVLGAPPAIFAVGWTKEEALEKALATMTTLDGLNPKTTPEQTEQAKNAIREAFAKEGVQVDNVGWAYFFGQNEIDDETFQNLEKNISQGIARTAGKYRGEHVQ